MISETAGVTLALEVPDVYACCEKLSSEGVRITRPPGR